MSKPKHRTAVVFVPELGRKVEVRGPTAGELKGTGQDISTPEQRAQVLSRIVGQRVVSPRLTTTQIQGLSAESVERIAHASMRLHPETAAMLRRAG